MRGIRRLFLGKTYGALVALAILCPPTLCYAQFQKCIATGISESIINKGFTTMMGGPPYTIWYEVEVRWDCSVGMLSDCRVCELGAIYKLNAVTNQYDHVSTTQTQDFVAACVRPNISTWSASIVVSTPGSYKIVEVHRNTNGAPCSDLSDFHDGDVDYVTIPN